MERKEKELLEQLISQRSGGDVNLSELRSYVQVSLGLSYSIKVKNITHPEVQSRFNKVLKVFGLFIMSVQL